MAETDYKGKIREKAYALIDLTDAYLQQTASESDRERVYDLKKLAEDIIDSCDNPNIGYNPYREYPALRAKKILEVNTLGYNQKFAFFSSETMILIKEIRSLALDWYKSVINKEEFQRYWLIWEIRDQILSLTDKESFPPEVVSFLTPLVGILIDKLLLFKDVIETLASELSTRDYQMYFNDLITVLGLIQTSSSFRLGESRMTIVKIVQEIRKSLSQVYQIDNPDIPTSRPYIHVEDLPVNLTPNILVRKGSDSQFVILETIKGEYEVEAKELNTIIAKLHSLNYFYFHG